MASVCRIVSIEKSPISYLRALQWQRALHAARVAGEIPDTLLLLEHMPVVTVGRGMESVKELLVSREELESRGIEVVSTDRGGRVTYHAPGQLIGYPILHLGQNPEERDLHRYLRNLEQLLIDTMGVFGLEGERKEGLTGVWIGDRKIAAIGIKVSHWVTMHGFALNIDTDLTVFRGDIVPCGIRDKDVTSMAECGIIVDRPQVEAAFTESFCLRMGRIAEAAAPADIEQLIEHSTVREGILAQ